MAYEQLKSEVLDILRCSDNAMKIKMYNADGNITLDSEEVEWAFIPDKQIIITMPNNEKILNTARGKVVGEVWYQVDIEYPYYHNEIIYTGKQLAPSWIYKNYWI